MSRIVDKITNKIANWMKLSTIAGATKVEKKPATAQPANQTDRFETVKPPMPQRVMRHQENPEHGASGGGFYDATHPGEWLGRNKEGELEIREDPREHKEELPDEPDPDRDTPEDIRRDKAEEEWVDPEPAPAPSSPAVPPNEPADEPRGRDRDDDYDDGQGVDGDFRKPIRR
jgi:hypothetical protein